MKKLLLFIAIAFVGTKAVAQVPTSGLVYRQDFTGNFNDTSGNNATSSSNTATLSIDEFDATSNSGNFDLGQTIEYSFATNPQLMVGTPTAEMSVSVRLFIDPTWLAALPMNEYITFLKLGQSYMRILKHAGGTNLQFAVYNGSIYGSVTKINSPVTLTSGWNTFTMTYGSASASLDVYVNGGILPNTSVGPTNLALIYNSATEKLVLGKATTSVESFKGKMDKVLVYNRKLTAAEVLAVHNDKPGISAISVAGSTHFYTLSANGSPTTSLIRYGTSAVSLTNTFAGASTSALTNATTTITGLANGVTYYYQIEATNTSGTTISAIKSFVAGAISEYDFDNTYTNKFGTAPFASNTGTTFVTDRNGNANSAIDIPLYAGPIAIISNLPTGATARTISIWMKSIAVSGQSIYTPFYYGTTGYNGLDIRTSNASFYANSGGNNTVSTTNNHGTWYHYVCTYNGTTSKIYKNGVLISSAPGTWNTTVNGQFYLGSNGWSSFFIGSLDDLKIFNVALTDSEILNLYYNNTCVAVPHIYGITENPASATERTINYMLNANNAATTSVIKYGTSSGNLSSQVSGGSASGNTATAVSGVLTGLTVGLTYYYQIEATNSFGTSKSAIKSFIHIVPAAIAEYSFDNTYNNILGTNPFTAIATTSFVADRNSNPLKAMYITNTGTTATIPNLPYGKNARTISMWHKDDNIYNLDYNYSFHYGAIGDGYGFRFKPLENGVYGSTTTSMPLTGPTGNATGTWYHFVCTYDGVNSKLYRNGVLISTIPASWETVNNSDIFSLGLDRINGYPGRFNGAVDDLKIYNYILSDIEIANLYNFNVLSNQNFSLQNLKATIYPNPASTNFTIEMENEVKSVEVYSIQGQTVMISNSKNIDVSNLSKGMYLVRIEDENNAVATQKLIIK